MKRKMNHPSKMHAIDWIQKLQCQVHYVICLRLPSNIQAEFMGSDKHKTNFKDRFFLMSSFSFAKNGFCILGYGMRIHGLTGHGVHTALTIQSSASAVCFSLNDLPFHSVHIL
jgi:hypothetical protein